jgi:glycerol-3-phosphate O-acyltransferase
VRPIATSRRLPYTKSERAAVIDQVVGAPAVREAAEAANRATGTPLEVVLASTRQFAEEIVPQYSAALHHRLAFRLARRLARVAYRVRVGYVDETIFHGIPADASVVFMMNHRSNMDYVLLSFLTTPYVALSFAVGEWAHIWPFADLLRSLGGFFVRRSSNDPLYRKVLETYEQIAIEQGITQAVFLEGGLSKDGRLRPAKMGLLSYMTKHYARDTPRDLVFVPVGVNYDRVFEDRVQLAGAPSKELRPSRQTAWSSAKWLMKNAHLYLRGRLHRFGYACVNFGTPISLKSYLINRGLDLRSLEEQVRFAETERLATLLMNGIANVIPVTPVSLVATALLGFGDTAVSDNALVARVSLLVEELVSLAAHVYVPRRDPDYFVRVGLRMLLLRRLVISQDGSYRIAPQQRPVLQYYANSIAHFFATTGSAG